MRPIVRSYTLVAGATGAIAASQTPAGAGNLLINGTLASGGVATMDTQRQVAITSASNLSALTFVIFGTDTQNRPISESLAGPNATTVNSVLSYLTVTKITISAAAGGALTVDTTGVGNGQEIPLDTNHAVGNVALQTVVTGTINYTCQYTIDDIYGTYLTYGLTTGAAIPTGPFTWNNITALAAQAGNVSTTFTQAGTALRLVINSGTGSVKFIVVQQGLI